MTLTPFPPLAARGTAPSRAKFRGADLPPLRASFAGLSGRSVRGSRGGGAKVWVIVTTVFAAFSLTLRLSSFFDYEDVRYFDYNESKKTILKTSE